MTGLDVSAWIAMGTWALVIGTLAAVWWQTRQQHTISSANTVMALGERFESSRYRALRKQTSIDLLTNIDLLARLGKTEAQLRQDETEVPLFFETLGLLTRRRVLDIEMVWAEFSWWAIRYYAGLSAHINWIRQSTKDPTLYDQFEWLYHRMLKEECRRRGVGPEMARPNEAEVRAFLEEECKLDT